MFALGRFGIKLELDTVKAILKKLGSPEEKIKTIHIAGTNGKGSIASYISSILIHSGFDTGLYTSPHLVKFNERFTINKTMISDDDVVESYLAVKTADIGERKATFFEITTAMAFYIFAKKNVEWAVIETGMGGRLDATNIINPEIAIISNISIEHTEYLGDTIEKIAAEKAGIIKPAVPVITGVSEEPALSVIRNSAKTNSAPFYRLGRDFSVTLTNLPLPDTNTQLSDLPDLSCSDSKSAPNISRFNYKGINANWENLKLTLPGLHQVDNASLALAACELLIKKQKSIRYPESNTSSDSLLQSRKITEGSIRKGLLTTSWPGRLEYILKNPTVIIDGAHNLQAAENLGHYLKTKKLNSSQSTKSHQQEKVAEPKYIMILGILDDKPYKAMLKHLLPVADSVIFTKAQINRSLEPETLKEFAKTISNAHMEIIRDVGSAVAHALKTADTSDTICIAGSLYVAGEARDKIDKDFRHPLNTS
ncbi:bifunctional folylpolyglutamate synthase/dihydrofolate synthase [Desulfamplus magnetovallimortis]|nr:folylpolyglutamate synthase/dihydrofolate synthase family protein [Desulfamplus magnetovallimortis]